MRIRNSVFALLSLSIATVAPAGEEEKSASHEGNNVVVLKEESITLRRISPKKYGKDGKDFFLMETEVTNEMFKTFLDKTGAEKGDEETLKLSMEGLRHTASPLYIVDNEHLCWKGNEFPRGKGKHPVGLVSIGQAFAYCEWLTKIHGELGVFRLPSCTEWEIAAYGDGRKYPWGTTHDPRAYRILPEHERKIKYRLKPPISSPEPVKARPAGRSPEGIYALWGNVSEFVISDPGRVVPREERDSIVTEPSWMGGSFSDEKIDPGKTYWGFTHSAKTRCEDIGFRVVLVKKEGEKVMPKGME